MEGKNEESRNEQEAAFRDTSAGVSASNGDTTQPTDKVQITVKCRAMGAKALLVELEQGAAWLPYSQIKTESQAIKGAMLTVSVPTWLLKEKQAALANEVRFSDLIMVSGYCTDDREKAVSVMCDADGGTRWLAKSKVHKFVSDVAVGQPIKAIVPAWMLKTQAGFFPSWVAGAKYVEK